MTDLAEAIAQRDLARDAAVALEQEVARLTESLTDADRRLRSIKAVVHALAGSVDQDVEVDLDEPVDLWGPGVVIPPEWEDPAPRDIPDPGCICGRPDDTGVTHTTESCCIDGYQEWTC